MFYLRNLCVTFYKINSVFTLKKKKKKCVSSTTDVIVEQWKTKEDKSLPRDELLKDGADESDKWDRFTECI